MNRTLSSRRTPGATGAIVRISPHASQQWVPAFAGMTATNKPSSASETGFTLVEVIIALALFALIALAGVTLLGSVLRVQHGTQGRLERLADEQRALFVIADDFGAMANAPLTASAAGVEFTRRTAAGPRTVRYALTDGVLQRALDHGAQVQQLLGGVAALRWSYYVRGKGWSERWPPSPEQAQAWPAAVAAELELAGQPDSSSRYAAGPAPRTLRRVVVLPLRPTLAPPRLTLPGQAASLGQAASPGQFGGAQ